MWVTAYCWRCRDERVDVVRDVQYTQEKMGEIAADL
jgi:hypothetical protein